MSQKKKQPQKSVANNTQSDSIFRGAYWITAFSIALLTFIIYLAALKNDFVNWDDGVYVYENHAIRALDFGFLKWVFTSSVAGLWHPLTMISHAVNYALCGLSPWCFHLTNNLFHSFNTFLVFTLSVWLIRVADLNNEEKLKKALIVGGITALLFGLHPLHVESVAWISERKDVLCTFFYLLSLLAYLKYATALHSKRLVYVACLFFFIMALISKPMAVSLPIVFLIIDCYPLRRLNIKGVLLEKGPFFLLSLLTSFAALWAHRSSEALPSTEVLPLTTRALVAIRAYMFYLGKMIFPSDLAPLYPYPIKIDFISMEYLGAVLLFAFISFFCIKLFKRNKLFFVVWVYYIATLIPVIGIIQVGSQAAADRYTYLPSIGPFLLSGMSAWLCFEKHSVKKYRTVMIFVLIFITGTMAIKTMKQVTIWHDSITLWSHQINLFPGRSYTAYTNRGFAYDKMGMYQNAIVDYNKAIEIDPKRPTAYNNRGIIFDAIGDYQKAMKDYNKAIEIDPKYAEAYDNRGGAYFENGDYQRAIEDYNKAIAFNPLFIKAYYNLGTVYNSIGDYQQAVKNFTKAIELNPQDTANYNNRGSAYNNLNMPKEAIKDYEVAIRLNPQDAYAYYNLGVVYSQIGDAERSIANYEKAAAFGLKEAQDYLKSLDK